jgi:hypothetical protein
MEYAPVDYGPRFGLGKLARGTYRVVDANSTAAGTTASKLYGTFSVSESFKPLAYTIKGTVHDDPYPLKRASMPVAKAKLYLRTPYVAIGVDTLAADRIIADRNLDSATTDANGAYAFNNVAKGSYRIICSHADYRPVTVQATISKDTAINFTVVPISSGATLTGLVTRIGPEATRTTPVAGCTVTVRKNDLTLITDAIIAVPLLSAVTDINGRYTIANIPIGATNEVWYATATSKGSTLSTRVMLANMRTDTVNFALSALYENCDSVLVSGAVFKIAASKFVYSEKEGIKIRYSITNTTRTDMTFGPFSAGCEYDLTVSAVASALGTAIYKASDNNLCLNTMVERRISVPAGTTVTYDFPVLYLSDLKWTYTDRMITPTSVTLNIAAQLRGSTYDNTKADVPVTVNFDKVATIAPAVAPAGSGASFDARNRRLSLSIDREQDIAVSCYTLGGALIGKTAQTQRFAPGMHTLTLRNIPASNSVYIVKVQGKTFAQRFTSVGVGK